MHCLRSLFNVFQSRTSPDDELNRYRTLRHDLRRVSQRPESHRFETHRQILENNPQKLRESYKKLPFRSRTLLSIQDAFNH